MTEFVTNNLHTLMSMTTWVTNASATNLLSDMDPAKRLKYDLANNRQIYDETVLARLEAPNQKCCLQKRQNLARQIGYSLVLANAKALRFPDTGVSHLSYSLLDCTGR